MSTFPLEGKVEAKAASRPVTLSVRMHLSRQHFLSALHFAQLTKKIEDEHHGSEIANELRTEYLAGVTGAVILSVASIESSVNDLYADAFDAVDGGFGRFKGGDPALPEKLRQRWGDVEGGKILLKYESAIEAAAKEPYNRGTAPYQPTHHLIQLRNALVHFFPEWDTAQNKHKKLTRMLKSKFKPSPFAMAGDEWFPKKCLGHGCAAWAVTTSGKFIDDFSRRLDMESWVAEHLNGL